MVLDDNTGVRYSSSSEESLTLIKDAFIWSKNSIINIFYFNVFSNVIYCCDAKLLQSSVSHDPSEIILICLLAAQETIISVNVKTQLSC